MNNFTKYSSVISMALMIIGVLLFLFSSISNIVYVYLAGALLFAINRMIEMSQNKHSKDVSRLPQIQMLSAISLLVAGYMMYDGSNSWSVLFIVSAILELYVSFRKK